MARQIRSKRISRIEEHIPTSQSGSKTLRERELAAKAYTGRQRIRASNKRRPFKKNSGSKQERVEIAKGYINQGHSTARILKALQVHRSTYYYKPKHGKRGRKASVETLTIWGKPVSNEIIVERIKEILSEPYCDYGYFKVSKELRRQGYKINHKKVYRLMKENKLLHKQIKRLRSNKEYVKYRKVQSGAPFEHLQIDIKYIYISGNRRNALLASIIDVSTRIILTHKFAYSIRKYDIIKMFDTILTEHPKVKGATLRSDNGSQFEANLFREYLLKIGIRQEFTHYATPQENAYIESYHSIIQRELCDKYIFDSFEDAEHEIRKYLQYYNERRLHSGIGYSTPNEALIAYNKQFGILI